MRYILWQLGKELVMAFEPVGFEVDLFKLFFLFYRQRLHVIVILTRFEVLTSSFLGVHRCVGARIYL